MSRAFLVAISHPAWSITFVQRLDAIASCSWQVCSCPFGARAQAPLSTSAATTAPQSLPVTDVATASHASLMPSWSRARLTSSPLARLASLSKSGRLGGIPTDASAASTAISTRTWHFALTSDGQRTSAIVDTTSVLRYVYALLIQFTAATTPSNALSRAFRTVVPSELRNEPLAPPPHLYVPFSPGHAVNG